MEKDQRLKERLLARWEENHEDYVNLVPRYFSLLERIREHNNTRGKKMIYAKKIKKLYLEEYPEIEVLCIQSRSDARKYIASLETSELIEQLNLIQDYLESYIYRTLINKIADYSYQLLEHSGCYADISNCYDKR